MTHVAQDIKPAVALNATKDNASVTALGTLIANGYSPVALCGKRPLGTGWQSRPNTVAATIAEAAAIGGDNWGLRTGSGSTVPIAGIDIDDPEPGRAIAVAAIVGEHCGPTPLVRIGKKGGMHLYHTPDPFSKMSVTYANPSETDRKRRTKPFEILGTGQQLVAFGTHPDTGRAYEWIGTDGDGLPTTPLDCPAAGLPSLTEDGARAVLAAVAGQYRAWGCQDVQTHDGARDAQKPAAQSTGEPVPEACLRAMLACLDPDMERDAWLVVLMALHAAPVAGDDPSAVIRRGLAVEWSRGDLHDFKPGLYLDDTHVTRQFDSVPPKEGGINVGTLIQMAREAGYTGLVTVAEGRTAEEIWQDNPHAKDTAPEPDREPDDEPAEADESWSSLVARFRGHSPADGANLPAIRFLDAEKTLPLTMDGAVLLWAGPWSAAKTALAMSDFMRRIKAHLDNPDDAPAVRVAYCIGEDLHGFMRQRVPAVAEHFGIPLDVLGRFWRTVEVPTLDQPRQVKAFCVAQATIFDGLPPTVLVVDTFATAAGAVDENSAEIGKLLLNSGAVGRIKRKLGGPLVLIIDHTGKEAGREARGHSSKGGNPDSYCQIEFKKDTRTLLRHVKKMRMAEDNFTLEYRVSPPGSVPIVTLIGRMDRKAAGLVNGADRDAPRFVLESLRWLSSWRKDRTTTKDLYLAVCRMDAWLADPGHHNPDVVLKVPLSEAEAAGRAAGARRLTDMAADQRANFGSAKIASRKQGAKSWIWYPHEAPGAELDDWGGE